MNLAQLTDFLEMCLVLNVAIILVTFVAIYAFKQPMVRIHSAMFNMSEQDVTSRYFAYLAQFKLMLIFFNLTPYLVLKFLI